MDAKGHCVTALTHVPQRACPGQTLAEQEVPQARKEGVRGAEAAQWPRFFGGCHRTLEEGAEGALIDWSSEERQ